MKTTTPIQAIADAYAAAVYAQDVDAFVALYDESARIFDLWETWQYRGAAEQRPMVEAWFGSLGDERVIVEFNEMDSHTSEGMAYLTAFVTYAAVSRDGERLRAMQNRLTWVLKAAGEGWKIIHEHTSGPADDMGKVMLQR